MAAQYPVVVLSGPIQAGKTTLAQQNFPKHQYVLLEDLDVREFAQSDPKTFLAQFKGGVILERPSWP
jgi:predicted kinase